MILARLTNNSYKSSNMFSYYQFLYSLQPQSFEFQNSIPFTSWNYGTDFQYMKFTQEISRQMDIQNHQIESIENQAKTTIENLQQTQPKQQLHNFLSEPQNNGQISILDSENNKDALKIYKSSNNFKIISKQARRRGRSQKKDKAYVAKQYSKQQPSIKCRYIQKNFELNIINQVFSFLWSQEKSHRFVKRFFKNDLKTILFYEYIKIVKKFCKRYINKEYLKNLCDYQNHHIAYKMVTKNTQKLEYLSMKEFSGCIRHLIFTYLHHLCPQAILTSKKMRRQIWGQHLTKCRLLRYYIFNQITTQEYERELTGGEDTKKLSESTEEN